MAQAPCRKEKFWMMCSHPRKLLQAPIMRSPMNVQPLRSGICFVDILTEEHQIQADVFNEMSKRGWYPVQQAEQQKIQQAKQKFENSKPQ